MKAHELLPCPFCGSDEVRLSLPTCTKDSKYDPADRAFPSVFCPGCSILVPGRDWDRSGESAIAAWNRRTDPATVQEALATARADRVLAKHQPCGCVICDCEDDRQCQGCGAKSCGTHPVQEIPNPVYVEQEQPGDGPVVGYTAVYDGRICHEFFNATPGGVRADAVAAGYDAPEAIVALYPKSVKDERERVRELEADARRWHFVRQFMLLDDVGDEDFCLGLIVYGESLSERVDPAAQRLYKDRWDARCRAEYQGEELDQGGITVDEAIDAAMQEGE